MILRNEFAKMRHLRVGLVAVVMVVAVLGLTLLGVVQDPSFDPGVPEAWYALLVGLSLGIPLVVPLLLAVLASRQTDIEHQGNGWLLLASAAVTPGAVCRAKWCALGVVVAVLSVVTSLLTLLFGRVAIGISAPLPAGHWVGFTACVVVVNLVLLAGHILLAARVENQLAGLGVAVVGTLIGLVSRNLPDAVAHLTPWGYYALAEGARYVDGVLVTSPMSYPSFAVLAVVGGVAFAVITSRFDRQEA